MNVDIWIVLAIALAGGIGAVIRVLLGRWEGKLPYGILFANTLASAGGAWVLLEVGNGEFTSVALIAGFAGGLSTFSAYVGQTVNYWRKGRLIQGVLNTVLQFGLPSTAVYLVALWCTPLIN